MDKCGCITTSQAFHVSLSSLDFTSVKIHKLTQTHTHTQPFHSSVDFVRDNPGEPVPEETFTYSHHHGHQLSLICFIQHDP